jgi:hypothetical protein
MFTACVQNFAPPSSPHPPPPKQTMPLCSTHSECFVSLLQARECVQPLVSAFKHAQDIAGLTYGTGLPSATCMHSCTYHEQLLLPESASTVVPSLVSPFSIILLLATLRPHTHTYYSTHTHHHHRHPRHPSAGRFWRRLTTPWRSVGCEASSALKRRWSHFSHSRSPSMTSWSALGSVSSLGAGSGDGPLP